MTVFVQSAARKSLRVALLCSSLLIAMPAFAAGDAEADDETRSASDIVVNAQIGYRNRSESVEPSLVYSEDYFQRFEPLTAGDALKRVPSVTFLSDVIESDGARLRGLDPGYTQILINGEKVPGSNADRSFFLDRIPAELIKQVEIVRSSSARRSGDAVAGTLNIVLRDALTMEGGYVRGGALYFEDGKVKPSGGVYYGGTLGPGRILVGANVQGRYNPKQKLSLRYTDSPENNPNFATDDFDNREDQSDVRDGTDYAGNFSYIIESATTKFELSANYVRTERTENERSFEYNDPVLTGAPVRTTAPGPLLTDNHNVTDITQESWSASAKIKQQWSLGEVKFQANFARFADHEDEFENEIDFDRSAPRLTADLINSNIRDDELSFNLENKAQLSEGLALVAGGFLQFKDRDTNLLDNSVPRNRRNLTAADRQTYDPATQLPDDFVTITGTLAPVPGGLSTIEEDRADLFALVEGESGSVSYEAGIRWEHTKVSIDDRTVPAASSAKYSFLLPSASMKYDLGNGRVTASAARTVRRPRFDFISPVLLEAELGDNDLLGNPNLKPESAWGADLGYEHRVGRSGIVGVNFFYRKITNLIEVANTGVEGSEGPGTWVYQPRNTGNGKVWGIEFDLSASLGFVGLSDTGIFGNLSLLDSSINDEFGSRRFNGQSKFVYNAGFIQNVPSWGASFGASYRKQGSAYDRNVGEEVTTTYGGDLEIFVEKRIGRNFTIRAVGSNLLDSHKDEAFNKFNTIGEQFDRVFDQYELETEKAGPVFQVVARFAF